MIDFFDEYLDLLDIVNLEMAIGPESSLTNMMEHMLKYQYNKRIQSSSWVKTIIRSYIELCNNKNIKISDSELNKVYKNAYKKASAKNNLPKELENNKPSEWTLEFLTNEYCIRKFLHDNYNVEIAYNIDIDDIFDTMLRNNTKKRKNNLNISGTPYWCTRFLFSYIAIHFYSVV